ncbi:g5697 [Coccomyxa elongata]
MAGLLGILISSLTSEVSGCGFGTLPGVWVEQHDLPEQSGTIADILIEGLPIWTPLDQQCQLEPLLLQHLQGAGDMKDGSEAQQHHIGILLFGDSVDYRIARTFCNAALGRGLEHMTDDGIARHHNLTGICQTPSLTVAKQHISSASLDGPYWWDMIFPPVPSITAGIQKFTAMEGGPPDVIMIASNFWDIAALYFHGGQKFGGTPLEHRIFPQNFMTSWTQNFTTILTHLQESVPEGTLLAYHTEHIPVQTTDPGKWETDAYLFQHVAQLNAAGRHVAQSLGFQVVDFEAMAAQLPKDDMLDDITHPKPDFLLQVLNMLLNIEREHRRQQHRQSSQQHQHTRATGRVRWMQPHKGNLG